MSIERTPTRPNPNLGSDRPDVRCLLSSPWSVLRPSLVVRGLQIKPRTTKWIRSEEAGGSVEGSLESPSATVDINQNVIRNSERPGGQVSFSVHTLVLLDGHSETWEGPTGPLPRLGRSRVPSCDV